MWFARTKQQGRRLVKSLLQNRSIGEECCRTRTLGFPVTACVKRSTRFTHGSSASVDRLATTTCLFSSMSGPTECAICRKRLVGAIGPYGSNVQH